MLVHGTKKYRTRLTSHIMTDHSRIKSVFMLCEYFSCLTCVHALCSLLSVPVVYADVQRGVPSTLAPWEEVEAKMAANNPPPTTKRGPPKYDPEVEFAALSMRPKNDAKNGYEGLYVLIVYSINKHIMIITRVWRSSLL